MREKPEIDSENFWLTVKIVVLVADLTLFDTKK